MQQGAHLGLPPSPPPTVLLLRHAWAMPGPCTPALGVLGLTCLSWRTCWQINRLLARASFSQPPALPLPPCSPPPTKTTNAAGPGADAAEALQGMEPEALQALMDQAAVRAARGRMQGAAGEQAGRQRAGGRVGARALNTFHDSHCPQFSPAGRPARRGAAGRKPAGHVPADAAAMVQRGAGTSRGRRWRYAAAAAAAAAGRK